MKSKTARIISAGVVIIVLVLCLYLKVFYLPIQNEIRTYARDISSMQELSSSFNDKYDELKEVNAHLYQLSSCLTERISRLESDLDSHDIIVMLSGLDGKMLVKKSLIFMEAKEEEDFILLPVRFHFTTNYSGFMDSLAYLDSLNTQVSISNLQISSNRQAEPIQDSMDESGNVLYNLDVEMTLNFCIGRD